MRRASQGTELIRNPDKGNTVIGFSLGADFVAEHEWGIDDLKMKLSTARKDNLDYWEDMIVHSADNVEFLENKDFSVLRTKDMWNRSEEKLSAYITRNVGLNPKSKWDDWDNRRYGKQDFVAAWDSKDFLIVAISETAKRNLKQLFEAFPTGNVVLSQMRNHIFRNGGIALSFDDRVPLEMKIQFNESCDDLKRLHKAAEETGIKKKLDDLSSAHGSVFDAPFKYYALSPKWKFKDKETKHPVMFWLNPMQQSKNNSGWFTVEELEQWIEGKGPVPKI